MSARPSPRLDEARKKLGALDAMAADLGKEGEAARVISEVIKKFGRIDILVTNTGGPPKGSFERLSTHQWKEGFQSLWLSAVEAIHAALPVMRKKQMGTHSICDFCCSQRTHESTYDFKWISSGALGALQIDRK